MDPEGRNFVRSQACPPKVQAPGGRRSVSRSATRALEVLELFGTLRRPLRAIEVSRELQLHPSTVDQLLKTMLDAAYLVFDARLKSYLPSQRLALFGDWQAAIYGADERLQILVKGLHAAAGEVVTLTTPNDLYMQVLDVADGGAPFHPRRGLRVSIFGSAVGGAFLSSVPDEEIIRLAGRARLPPGEIVDVLASATEIRRSGFAEGPMEEEVWSLATPLPPGKSPVPLVLGLTGPAARVRGAHDQIIELMRAAIALWAAQPFGAAGPRP